MTTRHPSNRAIGVRLAEGTRGTDRGRRCSFIELYRRRVRPAASVIVMSGRSDGRAIADTLGAEGYVPKPLEMDLLLRTVSVALAVA